MSAFFQKPKGSTPTAGGPEGHLTLAAFGKHPGWDDHIPGIGVETETLAYVKQSLYVGGIGKQIDSGAWEKLDPEKRLDGFAHAFLWLRGRQVLVGKLWSSVDRKGRSKYPMVLCVDAEGVAPELAVAKAWPELERLQNACKSATTAEQVVAECESAQQRLRQPMTPVELQDAAKAVNTEARRRFLDSPDLGPDSQGLMRALHELGNVSTASRHLRVPLAGPWRSEATLAWAAFLRSVLPRTTPLLLLTREGVTWLDIIVGDVTGDDFFCLQASPQSLPLTTEIPYTLPPELKKRVIELCNRFRAPGSSPGAPDTARAPATEPARHPEPAPRGEPRPGRGRWRLLIVIGLLAALGVAAWFLWSRRATTPTSASPASTSPAPGAESAATREYQQALDEARQALGRKDYAGTVAAADRALALMPDDAAATQLKDRAAAAQAQSEATLAEAARQQEQYNTTMNEARTAFERKDYAAALAAVQTALTTRSNDAPALKLKADAEAAQKADVDEAAIDRAFNAALADGRAALARQDYAAAVAAADQALTIKTNDPAATQLKQAAVGEKEKAEAAQAATAQREQRYQTALQDGRYALRRKDFAAAIARADAALGIKTNDAAALQLREDARKRQADAAAEAERDKNYAAAMAAAQAALDRKDFATAIAQAGEALSTRTNDVAAADLKKRAGEGQDLRDAQAALDRNDFDTASKLCAAHPGVDDFAALAKKVDAKKLGGLDAQLEVLLVNFNLLKPRSAQSPEGQKAKVIFGSLGPAQKDRYLQVLDRIESQWRQAGLLQQNDREKTVQKLRRAVEIWP